MGGGGDNGYEQRQQQTEASKQQARAAINAMFGMNTAGTAAPSADDIASQYFRQKLGLTNSATPVSVSAGDLENDPGFQQYADSYKGQQAQQDSAVASNAAGREGLYQNVRDTAFTAGKRKLDEQQQDAARKLKFELFATGQAGGSGDIDQNALMKRTYNQGVMDLGAKADAAKADFRNSDEDTRLQLLQSIDNGMDQGSALSQATQRMQIASDKAAADANGTAVGDLFDNSSLLYNGSQYAKGRQAGQAASFNPQQVGLTSKTSGKTGTMISNSAYGG